MPQIISSKDKPEIKLANAYRSDFLRRNVEIAKLYIDAFGGEPWFEKLKVRQGGKWVRMGTEEEIKEVNRMRQSGILEENDVKPFYTVQEIIHKIDAISRFPSLIGLIAWDENSSRIAGVSWGMSALEIGDEEKTNSVLLIADKMRIDADRIFYFDETFVGLDYRGFGVGRDLVSMRGLLAADNGFDYAIGRTINKIQITNFKKSFGEDNVRDVYADPEDIQKERKYYLIELSQLRRNV